MLEQVALVSALLVLSSSCWGLCPQQCLCPSPILVNCSHVNLTHTLIDIEAPAEILDLSFNFLETLSLSDISSLQELRLSHNQLTEAKFKNLRKLQRIDVSYNNIEDISQINLDGLPSLQDLNLAGNLQRQVNKLSSPTLRTLDLSSNDIYSSKPTALAKLPKLEKLNLSNNKLYDFGNFASSDVSDLDVSNNLIHNLTFATLRKFPSLLRLNISNNPHLDLVSAKQEKCFPLELADFSNTGMSNVDFSSFCNLKQVNLSFNNIRSIDEQSFRLNGRLTHLSIAANRLGTIFPKSFINNSQIIVLDVSTNDLDKCDWVSTLSGALSVDISNNQIKSLSFCKLESAIDVNFSKNKITSIDIEISENFPNIEHLDLRSNLIEYVQPIKSNTLKILKLGYCQLSTVNQQHFEGLPQLNFLDLEYNKLKRLDYKILESIPKLSTVLLGHNPWGCNCKSDMFKNLYYYLLANKTLTNVESLKCDDGVTWVEKCGPAYHPAPTPYSSSKDVFLGVGLFFLVAMSLLAGLIYCKARQTKILVPTAEAGTTAPATRPLTHTIPRVHRSQSSGDVYVRESRTSGPPEGAGNLSLPSYEEALLLPPLSETERMTRSMDLLTDSDRSRLPRSP